ncbi:cation diffusion facilitator family transporter [Haloplasma contractile]|uniref:Cation efflux system protein n=1 Tax=Haloplasma contractile SSD-17B TaxID=1033810 RepID=F7Q117_9MOLU|nr:cation diffusion facilitator family transporter [Haloplasma contractile]ERJ11340.1 Cation efflux system protein [Haloplasma contractile SSD-17B]
MGHDDRGSQANIKVAFFLNFSFAILEIIGGLWTNSMAILSDALHDLGDSFSLGSAWFLEKYSKKEPDKKFSFGYGRFSLLGALINSVILIGGSVFILTRSIPRLMNPEPINPEGMLIFAILGIIVNGMAVLRLKRGNSLNEKVVTWHLMEDILGWVVLLIASIVLMYKDIPILDPILSVFITLYVLYNVLKNLKQVFNVFLQGVPKNISIDRIEKEVQKHSNVLSVHHTHIWSLEGEKSMVSTHIVVRDDLELDKIVLMKKEVRNILKKNGARHITIELEFECEECKNKSCES